MSLGRLSIKTRLELETRVLAAALKISLQSGDLTGARLAHEQLTKLMKSNQAVTAAKSGAAPPSTPIVPARPLVESRPQAAPAPIAPEQTSHKPPEISHVAAPEPASVHLVTPAEEWPIEEPVIEQAPIVKAPIEQAPIEQAPIEQAPIEQVPIEQVPIEQVPIEQVPIEQVPIEQPSSQHPPSEQAPAQSAPMQTTVEAAPATNNQPQPQPTAADALHRSIVNTPMRASANNIPVIRSIDPDVLLAASSSNANSGDMTQKLSESLAKIEAAMNAPSMPSQSMASMLGGNGAHQTMEEPAQSSDEAKGAEHQYQGLYRLLGVSQMSPYEEIHKNFLIRVRAHIRQINVTKRPEKLEMLQSLRRIWIAHDILTDPVTRTDYDFRDLGLRGDVELIMPPTIEDKQQAQQTNRTPTRIGELLQCAGLLEAAELQIACDMHKAMPEVQFGTFLIKQGFIGERDLESVLLGQKLLRAGIISVAQFQVAMELSQSRGHTISDTLVERGYVTADGLEKAIEAIDAPPQQSQPTPQIIDAAIPAEIQKGPGLSAALLPRITDLVDFEPMEKPSGMNALTELLGGGGGGGGSPPPQQQQQQQQQQTPAQALAPAIPSVNVSQAVPSWKDQLDWDSPEEEPKPAHEVEATVSDTSESQVSEVPDPNRTTGINLGRALPSWKDQLDWESPESPAEESAVEGVPEVPAGVDASHDWPMEPMPTAPADASPVVAAYREESTEDHEISLPGDDWIDIDSSQQMETATHLQPITMDNLTLKQGKQSKKNKDKKKNKGQSQHSSSPSEPLDEIVK